MLKNKFLLAALLLTVLAVIYYNFSDTGAPDTAEVANPETYRQQMEAERARKNEFFRTNADSPVTDKKAFTELSYFDPDPAYKVTARLELFADKSQKLVVRMSDGSEEVYDKFAHAVFSMQGKVHRLLVVKLDDTYSILFRDATSSQETYGGGRYLEIDPATLTDNRAVLDFNDAYNPYCAYNPSYACPLPPAENTLPIAIKAGEKYVSHE